MRSSEFGVEEFPFYPRQDLRASTLTAAFFGATALLLCLVAVRSGDVPSAVATFSFAAFWGAAVTFAYNNQASTKTGESLRGVVDCSTIRYGAKDLAVLWTVAAFISMMMLGIGRAVDGPARWISFTVAFGFLMWFSVALISREIRPGWVELTPDGIRQRGWSFETEAAWDDIMGVDVLPAAYPTVYLTMHRDNTLRQSQTWRYWRIEQLFPDGMMIDCRRIDVHPLALALWIQFYVDYPAAREELGTDQAATRLILMRGPNL